jgi:uncharacterized membrane protein HdeD (DUF308 family)
MWDKALLVSMGVFTILFGIFSVTDLQVEWSKPLMGFAALICGIICIIRAVK